MFFPSKHLLYFNSPVSSLINFSSPSSFPQILNSTFFKFPFSSLNFVFNKNSFTWKKCGSPSAKNIIEPPLFQNIWRILIKLFIKVGSPFLFGTLLIFGPQITQIAKNLHFPFSFSFNFSIAIS